MLNLLQLYQKYVPYEIKDHVQELDFSFDTDLLRKELFQFIVDNKFGFSTVSLRIPIGENNYISKEEMLETEAIDPYKFSDTDIDSSNDIKNSEEYTSWHPDLKNSYIVSLIPKLEELCGLKIGKIRLVWLQPNFGYPMHADLEPMRLHIPLFTNTLSYFIHNHKIYKMSYGKLYHLISTNIHTAWNFGRLPRLHLVLSTHGNSDLENEIKKLPELELTSNNFKSTIENQGVDKFSLSMLYALGYSQWHKLKAKDWPNEPKNQEEFDNLSDQIKKELSILNITNFEELVRYSKSALNSFNEIEHLLTYI